MRSELMVVDLSLKNAMKVVLFTNDDAGTPFSSNSINGAYCVTALSWGFLGAYSRKSAVSTVQRPTAVLKAFKSTKMIAMFGQNR
jgi:hypothetical protein